MSPIQWILIGICFTLYLIFGGGIFMVLEQHHELRQKEELVILRQDVKEILLRLDRDFYHNGTSPEILDALQKAKEDVIHRISDACSMADLLGTEVTDTNDHLQWNFYNSVFFAFTVITTIGYGHLSPKTTGSRMFTIFYALVGIPLNGIFIANLSQYFGSKLIRVHEQSKEKKYNNKITVVFEILFYLIPGLLVFIILPAGIFVVTESWTFSDSVYFCFVTLSTIGFGDYVAGMGNGWSVWSWLYKVVIIVWIVIGLGYFVMIIEFITKGLKSKRVRVVFEKRLNNIRTTKEKLAKDVDYMRRVVNELYLLKVQPVYEIDEFGNPIEETNNEIIKRDSRFHSQPSLNIMERKHSTLPRPSRESDDTPSLLRRRCSETALDHIDKTKTFEVAHENAVSMDELFETVVNALSGRVIDSVMDAVDELNRFEQFDYDDMQDSGVTQEDVDAAIQSWDLLSDSDEEILIGDDSEDDKATLQEVVVVHHHDENKSHHKSILEKVGHALRKLSSGTKTPSDGPSRKVSRNESIKRKSISASRHPSICSDAGVFQHNRKTSRKDSLHHHNHFLNDFSQWHTLAQSHPNIERFISHHHQNQPNHQPPHDESRKISLESRHSNQSTISNSSKIQNHVLHDLNNFSQPQRKITPALSTCTNDTTDTVLRKISLETTSLANFLRALDAVHHRLKKTSPPNSAENLDEDSGIEISEGSRRRKVGVFNPDFSYTNHAFRHDTMADDLQEVDNEDERTAL